MATVETNALMTPPINDITDKVTGKMDEPTYHGHVFLGEPKLINDYTAIMESTKAID